MIKILKNFVLENTSYLKTNKENINFKNNYLKFNNEEGNKEQQFEDDYLKENNENVYNEENKQSLDQENISTKNEDVYYEEDQNSLEQDNISVKNKDDYNKGNQQKINQSKKENNGDFKNTLEELEEKLVSSTGMKVLATIMSLLWIINMLPVWYGTKTLPGVKSEDDNTTRIIWWVFGWLLWIPGIIISIKWIWIDN